MKYYETKIGKIIEEEFDSRMEVMVLSYILENGISNISSITEEEIYNIKGNKSMPDDFCQALVKCAVKICKECDQMEIMKYIRLYLNFIPTVREVTIYREDYSEDRFCEILKQLNLDEEDFNSSFTIYVIVDENT